MASAYKLLLAFLTALVLTSCSAKSWDWFSDDDADEEIAEEIVFDEALDESFGDEEVEETVYVYVDEEGNELYREVVSSADAEAADSSRRMGYEKDTQMMDEDATPPSRRRVASSSRNLRTDGPPRDTIVHFDYKKMTVARAGMRLLETHAAYLQKNPDLIVTVEGHTDSIASREYNKRLGLQRARAVAESLEEMGVSQSQMVTVSYGEERPLERGNSERANEMNRRVELVY